ncbi:divalent-cation tolerance protein CutA [Lysobacter sp. D1-1-M9]|uniref:divalent-cation tolerance protein CutA n=1 Tax=Novilysobacter longmucuonensis TaxID=3098603 RepID=UPI002FCC27A3
MTVLICLCTCPDAASARTLATALVEERLAACVNQLPGLTSTYRWEGRIEQADEVLLLIKTTREHLDALTARVHALHPAELPEVIAVEAVGGLAPYLDWVVGETGPARPAACNLPRTDMKTKDSDPMSPT